MGILSQDYDTCTNTAILKILKYGVAHTDVRKSCIVNQIISLHSSHFRMLSATRTFDLSFAGPHIFAMVKPNPIPFLDGMLCA